MVTSGLQGSAVQPSTLPELRMPYGAGLATVRVSFRLSGVLLVVAGALYMSTVVVDFLRGKADGAVLTMIGAVAQLVGGSKLVAQRYPAGPDTVRRSVGILGLAIGLGILTNSLRNLLAGGGGRDGSARDPYHSWTANRRRGGPDCGDFGPHRPRP